MKVGEKVNVNSDRTDKICFVEEVLHDGRTRRINGIEQQQVSLYAIDGEYIGDYHEGELELLDELMTTNELIELIKNNIDKKGLVKDFAQVLTNKGKEK